MGKSTSLDMRYYCEIDIERQANLQSEKCVSSTQKACSTRAKKQLQLYHGPSTKIYSIRRIGEVIPQEEDEDVASTTVVVILKFDNDTPCHLFQRFSGRHTLQHHSNVCQFTSVNKKQDCMFYLTAYKKNIDLAISSKRADKNGCCA